MDDTMHDLLSKLASLSIGNIFLVQEGLSTAQEF